MARCVAAQVTHAVGVATTGGAGVVVVVVVVAGVEAVTVDEGAVGELPPHAAIPVRTAAASVRWCERVMTV